MTPKIELKHVTKSFHSENRTVLAVDDISLTVNSGELVTLIGPSGSGKSTLFNLIVGLLEPDSGSICIDGRACGAADRTGSIGYMPQKDLLLPWRTVLDNAILPLEIHNTPKNEARTRARQMLPLFGLQDFADSYPNTLSGGMRQRAALLRTVLTDRSTILLDEPFGALDALTRRELQDWLLGLWQQFNQTILFVTHDVEEALYLADRVVVLSARPGRVNLTLDVNLPRPRKRAMITTPEFGAQMATLLEALGIV